MTNATAPRKFLKDQEITDLLKATERTRYPDRNRAIVLIMYRHGLRVAELVRLTWDRIRLDDKRIDIRRVKHGKPSIQVLNEDEIDLLGRLPRSCAWVFLSERDGPLTTRQVHRIIEGLGQLAGIPFPIHPHMLRHSTGYRLINRGASTRMIQDYLGHRNIRHTEVYTDLDEDRFNELGALL